MKKLLSIILAILMIVTTVPFAFAAEGDTDGTTIVITMTDHFGDGWTGNAVVIEQLIDGAYTEVATATFEDGDSETFTVVLTEEGFYTFKWKAGEYPEECAFTLEVDDEVILKVNSCIALSDGECLYEYVLCNHNYVDGKCDICGSDCLHKNITDSKCDACGAEGKFISITMIDDYDNGWTGNAIQLDLVSKGEFTKIADATIETGSTATYRTVISSGEVFSLKWKVGECRDECSFTVKVNGEIVFEKSDCSDLTDNELIYINCNHNFIDSICSICGLTCGVDFSHNMNGGIECISCGFVCNHNYTNHYCKACSQVEDGCYAGTCGANDVNDVIWSLDSEGTLTISGEGEYDIPYLDAPWKCYGENIKNVVIEEGITNIDTGSFYDLPNTVALSIPSTVASINTYYNNGFAEIKLADGNNYYSVVDSVLFNSEKTELIMYPAKKAGETYTVPDDVTTLCYNSFEYVKNLKTVNISDDVTIINSYCFSNSSVENINFGKNVEVIESNAFAYAGLLKTVVLPEKLTEISLNLFYDCNSLENLVIGSNVTKIGKYVLDYCHELKTVHFLGAEEQWQAITKPDDSEDEINTVAVHFGALEEKDAIDETCTEAGYTAGLYCDECNAYITGEVIPATGEHTYVDGKCEECGAECEHAWNEVLTRPIKIGLTGWKDGYYTYTCLHCGVSYQQEVKTADYSAYDEMIGEYTGIMQDKSIKISIRNEMRDIYLQNPDVVSYSRIESEQEAVDAVVEIMKNKLAEVKAAIEDGSALQPVYDESEILINEIIEMLYNYGNTYVTEVIKEFDDLYNEYFSIYHMPETTKAQVDEITERIRDLKERIEKGIEDGSIIVVDGTEILLEYQDELRENLISKYGEEKYNNLMDSTTDEVKAEAIAIEEAAGALTGTVAENAEKIAEIKARIKALFDKAELCLAGTHSYTYEEISPAKCGENAVEEGACWFCGKTDTREVADSALTHSFTKYEETEAPKCGVEGKEVAYCDNGCGATDEKAIEALKHDIVIDEAVAPKCGESGLTQGEHCTRCDYKVEQEVVPALRHSFTKYEITEEAKCGVEGKEVAYCDNGCGATNEKAIAALIHKDADGDYKCDNGCGHEFEKPAEPDTPDTPDEPSDDACDHLCHKGGFMGFIWKIVKFFWKLFKMNPVCECGAAHY